MPQKTTHIGADVDPDTNHVLKRWADDAGRSKKRHAAILLRRLAESFTSNREELKRLGLLDADAA